MSLDRISLERERIEVFARTNAQEINKALHKLEEHREQYRTRWVWELIQNARDARSPDRRMAIEISATSSEIRFRHNGRPFTRKEVLSLIYHGSTKPEATEAQLGKFGTGFLSTHLLSRVVHVVGTLNQPDRAPTGFQFVLDRSGTTDPEIEQAMEKSYLDFTTAVDSESQPPTEWTEYSYHLSVGQDSALLEDLDRQMEVMPYVVAFESNIRSLAVTRSGTRAAFRVREVEQLGEQFSLITVENSEEGQNHNSVQLATVRQSGLAVAVPVGIEGTAVRILPLQSVPRLFAYLPLIRTANIGIPAVVHCGDFRPTEERDGLYLVPGGGSETEANRDLLQASMRLVHKLANACAAQGWQDLSQLLHVHPPIAGECPWLADLTWYSDLQRQLIEGLAAIPLIRNRSSNLIRFSEAVVPIRDELLEPPALHALAVPLHGDALPNPTITGALALAVADWPKLLEERHPLIQRCMLRTENLFAEIRKAGTVFELAKRLSCDSSAAIGWINDLIQALPSERRLTTFDGLLPDQTGVFRRHANLSRDGGIDDVLKDALEAMGEPFRTTLLHRDVRSMDAAIPRMETADKVAPRVKEGLKKRATSAEAAGDQVFREACLSSFGWFAKGKRWTDLRDSFPVFTIDRDGTQALHRTSSDSSSLLTPPDNWPVAARPFWDAFPPRTVLVNDYMPIVTGEIWHSLADAGVVIGDLVWDVESEITDELIEELSVEPLPEGQHSATTEGVSIRVGRMALVGTKEFYESVRGSQERAARFLRFVLEYVALVDTSWSRRETIQCECDKAHEVIPSDWLAWIRRTHWIPIGKHTERLSTETLAFLAKREPWLATLITQERIQALLELLGVNILEQALLGVDESKRTSMRRKLAELAKVIEDPQQIDDFLRDLTVKQQVTAQWQSNQALGRKIEQLIKALLEDLKVKVEVHFRGYDLDAYLSGAVLPDNDIGQLEIGRAMIEIKATRSNGVSMSDVQGETAASDSQRYWLCVVVVDTGTSLDSLDLNYVRNHARFVPGIGKILSHPHGELMDAVNVARTAGVELQHVDGIRYLISESIWERDGVDALEFVRRASQP